MNDTALPLLPAAEYVRMSTEHQQYSTENQRDAIRRYASARGMVIVRTFTDAGKSGLRIDGRDALKELIRVVEHERPDFQAILVYDVSRWGRFQDADESAYYEYVCRRAHIQVHYCAEQFENDGSPVSTIVKGVKRAMAGEYSRELSAKVFAGQCRLIELGFHQGGSAGFGLRRVLLDVTGAEKAELHASEHKSIQTDRVQLRPGPEEELATVRWIYAQFLDHNRREPEIADALNARGVCTDLGRPWTRGTVHQILTNEKYIGNNVYNRRSFKLKRKRVANPPEMWIRKNAAFAGVVSLDRFERVQQLITERSRRFTDDELLAHLRMLLDRERYLSGLLIDETDGMASSAVYRHRFKSLVRAYQLVGYTPDRDYEYLETNRRLRRFHSATVTSTIAQLRATGGIVRDDPATGLLVINDEFTTSLVIARCRHTNADTLRWLIRIDVGLDPDLTLAVRMDADNRAPLDYYVLPRIDVTAAKFLLREDNGVFLDNYRFASLEFFVGMARRTKVWAA
jgi:DNA invertase Pin-like site-specific DNA recombinase